MPQMSASMNRFSLRITGNGSSRTFALQPGDISRIGRAVDSHILIADPNISRHQLTLFVREDRVDLEMNNQSSNQLVKNGKAAQTASLTAGEFFDIGPYRFELEAISVLPQATPHGLPPDPAGEIDIRLAAELNRIAPRWSTLGSAGAGATAGEGGTKTRESPLKKVLFSAAAVALACMLGWEYVAPSASAPGDEMPAAPATADQLLASIQPPSCHSPDACLNLARESFNIGEKLRTSGARDLVTLYRVAKQYHRASQALGGAEDKLPQLPDRLRQARQDLLTAFVDVQFHLDRARAEGDNNRQLAALQTILALCSEDRLPICTARERMYQQLRERQMAH